MFCKNCGKANPDNQRFCSGCGADLMGGAPGSMNTPQSSGFNTSPNFNQGFGFGNNGINMNTTNSNGKGFAIASLVLGIVSFFCFGIIAGALAIIFGYVAKNKGSTVKWTIPLWAKLSITFLPICLRRWPITKPVK